MRVYHFLKAQYGLEGIKDRRLKISRFTDLNDPFEWAAPASSERKPRQAFEKMKAEMSKSKGLICLSKSWQNPLLWSHYADRHRGLCLGFDVPNVPKDLFYDVIYQSSRSACDWQMFANDRSYRLSILEKVMRTKFSHWKYEQEVRVHISLDHTLAENGKYFFNFSDGITLAEVIVGSLSDVTRTMIVDAIDNDSVNISIKKARLAFKSFRVVEQNDVNFW